MMKVSLGTIEVDDATRKRIRRDMGKSGVASRDDVKKYMLDKVDQAIAGAGSSPDPGTVAAGTVQPAGGLPEPGGADAGTGGTATTTTGAGTTGGDGTTPSTGNLGSAGTPGGTV